jgi:hypothetical protein
MSKLKLKPKRPKRQVGDFVTVDYGTDASGQFFFWCDRSEPTQVHGPFRSLIEAEENSRVTLLGPQCEVEHGGKWDPAWDRAQ